MGDALGKWESLRQNRKDEIYTAINSFPKRNFPKCLRLICWAMSLNILNCLPENLSATALFKNGRFSKLKACVCYFYQIFIYAPNDSPSKTMKNVFYFI